MIVSIAVGLLAISITGAGVASPSAPSLPFNVSECDSEGLGTARATVEAISVKPQINVALAASSQSMIPGDSITYSGTVSNTGSTLTIGGSVKVGNHFYDRARVASFFLFVEYYSAREGAWVPLAGAESSVSSYEANRHAPISSGLNLVTSPEESCGVEYSSGNPVGTSLDSASTGRWAYSGQVSLSAAKTIELLDEGATPQIRAVTRFELESENPSDPQSPAGPVAKEQFGRLLNTQTGQLRNPVVNFSLPSGEVSQVQIGNSISPAESSTATIQFGVPVPSPKSLAETNAEYLARLSALDKSALNAAASATADTDGFARLANLNHGGNSNEVVVDPGIKLNSATVNASAILHLPIVLLDVDGPDTVHPGESAVFELGVENEGSAHSEISLQDIGPGGMALPVQNAPASLAPGETGEASAQYDVPSDQAPSQIVNTSTVAWTDANGNSYGPVSGVVYVDVLSPTLDEDAVPTTDLTPQYPLTEPQIKAVQGVRDQKDGECVFSTQLYAPPGINHPVQAAELSWDDQTCTSVVAVWNPETTPSGAEDGDGGTHKTESTTSAASASASDRQATVSDHNPRQRRYFSAWTEDPVEITVNRVISEVAWSYDGSCVLDTSHASIADHFHWFWLTETGWNRYGTPKLRRIDRCSKTSARIYAKFQNKDFPACRGKKVYVRYWPNRVIGLPDGGAKGLVRWKKWGAGCKRLLRVNQCLGERGFWHHDYHTPRDKRCSDRINLPIA